jgi:hypothetical protein
MPLSDAFDEVTMELFAKIELLQAQNTRRRFKLAT